MENTYFFTKLLFTLTWITCLTYLLSLGAYKKEIFIPIKDKTLDHVDEIAHWQCWIMAMVALMGSMFIRTGTTHGCTAIFICITCGLAVPSTTIYSLWALKQVPVIDAQNVTSKILNYTKEHGKIPEWLDDIQQKLECCGIHNITDYRNNLFSKSDCESRPFDIPSSCLDLLFLLSQCKERNRQQFCNASDFMGNAIVFKNKTMQDYLENNLTTLEEKAKFKCEHVNGRNAHLSKDKKFNGSVHEVGCLHLIVDNTNSIAHSHYILFFSLLFTSLIMLISFMTFWVEEGRSNKGPHV